MKTIKFKWYHFFVWGFGYYVGYYLVYPYHSYSLGLMAAFSALFFGFYFAEKIHDITSVFLLGVFGGSLVAMPSPIGPAIAAVLTVLIAYVLIKLITNRDVKVESSVATIIFESMGNKL